MKELLTDSQKFYYSDLLLITVSLYCAYFIYQNTDKEKEFHYLYLYPLSSFFNSVFNYYILYFSTISKSNDLEFYLVLSNLLFSIIEFYILSFFLQHFTKNIILKKLILLLQIIYIINIFFLNLTLSHEIIVQISYILNSIYITAIGILCLIGMFKFYQDENLIKLKIFWILSGVFIYFIGTIPIFLFSKLIFHDNYYISEEKVYSINYIAYIILFSSLSISTKCNTITNQ